MSLPNCRSFIRIALSIAAACAFAAAGAIAAPNAGREPAPAAESGGLNSRPSGDEVRYLGHAVAPGQYIGRLKAKVGADSKVAGVQVAQMPAAVGTESVQHIKNRRLAVLKPKPAKVAALRAATATERQRTVKADLDALMATGLYEYVEPDYIQYATAVPSDTSFADGTLWGLRNSGQNGGLIGADINVVAAWDLTTGSSNVVVGVIDTGIRYTHQDLAAQMWVNSGEIAGDGIDNDNNGYVDDIHGINAITGTGDPMDDHNHGTHCAGTIGASANDSGPIVGVAWNVRLMGLKFLNAGGSGDTSHAIKCIEYALSKGVRILSNSWGGGGPSQALEDAIKAARDQGCLFLAAAGNAGADADRTDFYPACYKLDNIVSIGALDRSDNLAGFTNTGLSTVDLAAPGVDVYSSIASDDSAYASFSGTSMATPHVAGVAALVLAQYPGISMAELRQRLIASTREVAALRGYSWSGGAVDAYRALTITEDGALDVRSSAAILPLRSGSQESLFLTVTDLVPVLGASVTGTLAGAPLTFIDDGAAPDRVANDGVYSAWATVPNGVTETALTVAITATGKAPYAGTFTYPVSVGPVNDDFAAAIDVPFGTTTVTGTNIGAGEEPGEPRHGGVGAGRSVWWTWTAPSSGVAAIGTTGTGFFAVVGVYTGDAVSSLTSVGSNLGGSGVYSQSATFLTLAGTTYRIAVDCIGRAQGNIVLNFPSAVVPLPTNDNFIEATPLLGTNGTATGTNFTATRETGEPIHAGNPGGGSVWWTWTAPTSGTYHWSTSGSSFDTLLAVYSGDTVAALTEIASNDESNSGNTSELTFAAVAGSTYRIAVDGRYGSRGIVQLAFEAVTAPVNDNLADAIALSGITGAITGTNRYATGELGEPIHINSNATATSVWYSWTAAAGGYQEFDTDGSSFDTALAVYTGSTVDALTAVVSNDNNGADSCSRVVVPTTAGTTYRIAVGDASYRRTGGALVLNHRQVFAPSIVTQPVSTIGAIGGTAEFAVTAIGSDLFYQWYHNGASVPGATAPSLQLTNLQREDGGTYQVIVSNTVSSVPSAFVTLTGANPPPEVSAPVLAIAAVSGSDAQLTVTAGGVGELTYQWRHFGVAIPGAVGPTLEISPATMADEGLYDVIVFDGLSQTLSAATRLQVTPSGGYPDTLRLDTNFAPWFESPWASIEDIAVAPSGDFYAVGIFSTISGQRRHGVARFTAALALDPTFAPMIDGTVYAVLAQPDGKVVVGGMFTSVNGEGRNGIARLNADGTLDTTFDPGQGISGGTVWALARQANGRIVVAGNFYSYDGNWCSNLVRVKEDGSRDGTFITSAGPNSTVGTMMVQPDGRILIGGWFTTVGSTPRNHIARLSVDGANDATFDPGSGFSGSVESLAVQPDGKVVVGGSFTQFNGVTCNRIARLDASGALDTSFITGSGFGSDVRAVAVLADGRIAVSSWWTSYNGGAGSSLFVLTSGGAADAEFSSTRTPSGACYALCPLADGGFLGGGNFNSAGSTACSGLVRYSASGSLVAMNPAGFRQPGSINAAVPVADGQWVVGGYFSYANGIACSNLTRLNADGSVDTTFAGANGPTSTVQALAVQGDGKILAGGWFNSAGNRQRNSIARFNVDGTLDTSFDSGVGFNGNVTNLAVQADGKLVAGGSFTSFGGLSRNRIARLNADGTLDVSFDPGSGFNQDITSIQIGTDGRLVAGGNFTTFDGVAANYIAKLLATGARDPEFAAGTGFSNWVNTLALASDGGLLASGYFNFYNGAACGSIVRLFGNGSLDTSFVIGTGPNSGSARMIAPQADGRILIGDRFTTYAGVEKRYLARLESTGLLDESLSAFDLADAGSSVRFMDDGGVLIIAGRGERNGVLVRGLVRLKPDIMPLAVITAQPASQTTSLGDAAVFSVTATGDALRYQWFHDGVAIAGATGSTLTIPNVGPPNVGDYTVRVWNRWSSVMSHVATLTGSDGEPVITTQPGVVTATSGGSATFTVAAAGPNGIAFQWRHLGVAIPGATGATLTLPSVTMADAGLYDVVVYNGLTPLVSQAGRLVVAPANGYADTLRPDAAFAHVFETNFGAVNAIALGSSGEVYAVGDFSRIAGVRRACVARFDATLALDPTFAPVANGSIQTVHALAGGKVLLSGSFTTMNGVPCLGLARLLSDGTLDASFVPGVEPGSINSSAVQPDGRIVLGGSFYLSASGRYVPLIRLNADGTLDASFATDAGLNGSVIGITLLTDGRMMIRGYFNMGDGSWSWSMKRLGADGALDVTFSIGSGFSGGYVETVAVQADGKLLVGGWFNTYNGTAVDRLVRLAPDGTLDASFTANFDSGVRVVSVFADGRIAVGGWFGMVNGSSQNGLAVLDATGATDVTFNPIARPNSMANAVYLLSDGGLLVAGSFSSVGSAPCSGLVRYSVSGTVLWANAPGLRQQGSVRAAVPVADGKWVIGGYFAYVDDIPCTNIVRLNADGSVDMSFDGSSGPAGNIEVLAAQGDGKILVGGWFTMAGGRSRNYIARFNTEGALDTTFDPGNGFNAGVNLLEVQADGQVLAGGDFGSFDGSMRRQIVRLTEGGALDTTFDIGAGLDGSLRSVAICRDGRLVLGGGFSSFDGTTASNVARLLPSGAFDPSFTSGSGFNSQVEKLVPTLDDGILAAGHFSSYDGTSCRPLVRLQGTGALDTAFSIGSGPNAFSLTALIPQTDGRLLIGGPFTVFDGVSRNYLVRLESNGTVDPAFEAFGLTRGCERAYYMDDGGLLLINAEAQRNGTVISGLVRLTPVAQIVAQPVDQDAKLGDTVTFAVTAEGDGTLSYQWFKDGVVIDGATGSTLTLSHIGPLDVANYTVRIGNAFGSVLSSEVTIVGALTPPVIVTQPTDTVGTAGQPLLLSVGIDGGKAPAFQWRKQGVPIAGATMASYSIASATMADAGYYDVVIDDDLGVLVSDRALVQIAPPSYGTTFRLDPTFSAQFERRGAGITTLAVTDTGSSYITGSFTTLDGQRREGFARLTAAATLDADFNPVVNGTVSIVVPQGTSGWVLIGGSFNEVNGVPCKGLARLSSDGVTVDPSFQLGLETSGISRLLQQPDGKLLVSGSFADSARGPVVRFNADGTLDPTWTPTGTGSAWPQAMALQADGKIVVATFSYNGTSTGNLVRLNADGTRDPTFVIGTGFDLDVAALAIQPDGKIVVAGNFTTYNGIACKNLVRLDTNGTLDPTLSVGSGVYGVSAILPQPDGKLVLGGTFTSYNGTVCANLVRISASGALDPTFAAGNWPDGNVSALGYDAATSQIIVGGSFTAVGATPTSGLARYRFDGSLAGAISANGRLAAWVTAAVPAEGGNWVVAGDFTHINGDVWNRIGRLHPDGSVDNSFAVGSGFNDTVNTLVRTGDGALVAGGSFTSFNGIDRSGIARLHADGSNDAGFVLGTGFTDSTKVLNLAAMPDGRIVVAGDFTTYNGMAAKYITRLLHTGERDTSFSNRSLDSLMPLGLAVEADGRILCGSWWMAMNNWTVSRTGGVRLHADGSIDPSFDLTPTGVGLLPWAFAVQPDGKFIISSYTNGTTQLRQGIARFNNDGSFDPSYGSATESIGLPTAINLLPDGRLLASGYMSYGGIGRSVGRYLADGTPDPSFASFDYVGSGPTIYGAGGAYYTDDGRILVTNASGRRGSIRQSGMMLLRPEASPAPVIVTAPASQTVALGATAVFTVVATGEGALVYEWTRNGEILPGESESTLTLTSVTADDFGVYSVAVSSLHGRSAPVTALLTVHGSTGPEYRLLDYYHPLAVGNQWTYLGPDDGPNQTHSRITLLDLARPTPCYDSAGQPTTVPTIVFEREQGVFNSGFTATDWGISHYTVGDDSLVFQGDDETGSVLQWRVPGGVRLPPILAGGESAGWSGRLLADGYDVGPLLYGVQLVGIESVSVPAGTYPAALHLRIITVTEILSQGREITVDDEWWAAGIGLIKRVHSVNGGSTGSTELLETNIAAPTAPAITAATSEIEVARGEAGQLSVTTQGTAPLTYQWFRGDSGDLSQPVTGAHSASFTTPALTAWARYWVRVSNPYGTADSPVLLVKVLGGTMTLPDWTAQDGVPADQRGPLASPAGDGVSNLMKFAFGVHPLDTASAHLPAPSLFKQAGQPDALALLFTMNPGAQGIRYALEVSADLITWDEVDSNTEDLGTNPDGTLLVRLREVAPPTANRRFARLRIVVLR